MKWLLIYNKMNTVNKFPNKSKKVEKENLIEYGDKKGSKVLRKISRKRIRIFSLLTQSRILITLINKLKIILKSKIKETIYVIWTKMSISIKTKLKVYKPTPNFSVTINTKTSKFKICKSKKIYNKKTTHLHARMKRALIIWKDKTLWGISTKRIRYFQISFQQFTTSHRQA